MVLITRGGRGRRIAALLLVLAVGATAWALTGRFGGPGPKAAEGRALSPAELNRLGTTPPIYALVYSWGPEKERIATAQQRLITACMTRQGFGYRAAPVAKAGETDIPRPRPFGVETLETRAAGADESLPPEQPRSKAFTRALYGDPDDKVSVKGRYVDVDQPATGCQAEAEKRLLGDGRERWLTLRLSLGEGEREALESLERDPAYRSVTARWQECMARAGFKAATPAGLLRALPAGTDVRRHPAVRADLRCKADTDYLRTAYARLAALQQRWLDAHPDVLAERTALFLRQRSAADRVLGA
ncbi:hypothetical protein ABZ464_18110 [Streptomyces sp. NPDC005820]|uniref:hypothetical protein n=1 Tax=Streptomyces sp. NPDC005820 TaxID=3157069 RepID=UPI0033C4D811